MLGLKGAEPKDRLQFKKASLQELLGKNLESLQVIVQVSVSFTGARQRGNKRRFRPEVIASELILITSEFWLEFSLGYFFVCVEERLRMGWGSREGQQWRSVQEGELTFTYFIGLWSVMPRIFG